MFTKLVAFLTGGEVVYLQDKDLEQYKTIAYVDKFGNKYAQVYPFTRIGYVILNSDGSTSGKSRYIKKWIK